MDVDDTTKHRIRIARFLSYLEKHRIFELFYELITLLLIKRPTNHISFMKDSLELAVKRRDTLRIILLSPPDFGKKLLAEYLKKEIGIRTLTLQSIQSLCNSTESIAKNVERALTEQQFHDSGWLFIDLPRDKSEARALQRIGILPTHVVEIAWTNGSGDTCANSKSRYAWPNKSFRNGKMSKKQLYNLNIGGLREAYANNLIKLETAGQTYEELGNLIIKITKKQRYHVPCIFRVLLIGSLGSGCRTVARYLFQRYGLVHVDFDYLLEQTRKQNSPLGEELRRPEYQWGTLPKSDTRIKVVENKLMSPECIKKGWVLTGYPLTVEDFQLLNSLTTPPNRIIFLNVDQMTCRERLLSRRFNLLTGSEHHLPPNYFQAHSLKGLGIHSKDYRSRDEQDIQEYEKNIGMLLEYAGDSIDVVDGNAERRVVQERVEACLTRPITRPLPSWLSKLPEKIISSIKCSQNSKLAPKISDCYYQTDSELSLLDI